MIPESGSTRLGRDVDFASDYLGLPVWRIYSEAQAGRLPYRRVGRRMYFTVTDLEAYKERVRRNGDAAPAPGDAA